MDRLITAERKSVSIVDHIWSAWTRSVAFGNTYDTEQVAHKKPFGDIIVEAMVMRSYILL
jgi:hypothetical protein